MRRLRSPARVIRLQDWVKPYRLGDLLALGFWQCPPWIIVGDFIYQWQINNADLTVFWIGVFVAAFTGARVLCRLMQLYVLRAMPVRLS